MHDDLAREWNPARAEIAGHEGDEPTRRTTGSALGRETQPDVAAALEQTGGVHPALAASRLMPTAPGPDAHPGVPTPELDRIVIERLHVRGYHGVFDHERQDGQDFFIDAEVWLDSRVPASSDDIDDTLHYGHLMRVLYEVAAGEPVDLLETLVERLAAATLSFAAVHAVRITVHKPKAPVKLRFDDVSVSVLRFRPQRDDVDAIAVAPVSGGAADVGTTEEQR